MYYSAIKLLLVNHPYQLQQHGKLDPHGVKRQAFYGKRHPSTFSRPCTEHTEMLINKVKCCAAT